MAEMAEIKAMHSELQETMECVKRIEETVCAGPAAQKT